MNTFGLPLILGDAQSANNNLQEYWIFAAIIVMSFCLYEGIVMIRKGMKMLDDEQGKGILNIIGGAGCILAPLIGAVVMVYIMGVSTPMDATLGL